MSDDQLENNQDIGELLSEAREKLSLSQKEIASRLNLKDEIIAALDTNDFDRLPAPAYVKGYIRSYARAVNLNADKLINIYEGIAAAAPEILPAVKPKVQASSTDKPVKTITYLITFTLIIMVFAWWQGQHTVDTNFFSNAAKTSQGGKYPGGFTYTYDIVNHPETLHTLEVGDLDDDKLATVKMADLSQTSDPESDHVLTTEDSLDLNAQINPDTLEIKLIAESWIEVYDISGNKLYLDLAKPGEKITLVGTAPLSVKLGNASAVSVTFNNKVFDTSTYTRAGVAQFLLE